MIQWTIWEKIDDLDSVNDVAFLSHTHIQMQKTDRLSQAVTNLFLTPNAAKTQVIHSKTSNPILIHSTTLTEAEVFTYLGNVVDSTRGTDANIKSMINKTRVMFTMLRKIWSSKHISIKIRIFNSEAGVAVWIRDMENNKNTQQTGCKHSLTPASREY